MRVLLVHPWTPELFPPPAIGYLRAALEQQGHTVVSAYMHTYPTGPFDVIGVSLHSFSVQYVPHVLSALRHNYTGAHIVAGGHHATALPAETLALGFDQVVLGTGEDAICAIANGARDKIYEAPLICNTSLIPNYDGLDQGWTLPMGMGGRAIGILSSRGCPFECSFCASTNFWKRHWYPLDPDEAMRVLEAQLVRYNLTGWMFEDDNFTLKTDRAMEICDRIKFSSVTHKGTMPWHAASRAESLCSEYLCMAMRSSGCTHVWLGIESLCQETLDRCKKSTHIEAMLHGISTAKACGMTPVCQFIVGLPGETEKTFAETLSVAKAHGVRPAVNKAWVLPGTDIHKKALEHGFKNEQYLQGVPYYEYEWAPGTLDRWAAAMRSI